MHRKVTATGAFCFALLFWFSSFAFGQTPADFASARVETVELLRRGQQLEVERRWGDAISYYEEAVRQFPEDRAIEQRFEVARLHYDLGRRYNDQSFCNCVQQLSAEQALDLYHEVLLKIQAHYVEAPDWKELLGRGLAGLDVALAEPTFAAHNGGAQIKAAAIDEYRQQVQKLIAVRSIATCADVRDAVAWAAQVGHEQLGIAASAVVLEFLCGATNSLDPYSAYLTPNQLSEVYSQIEGNFVGIGVELKPGNGTLSVVRAISGSPAQQSGILAGDQIVAIGDRWVRDCPPDQAANLLQGEAGTTVDVTVVTGAQPQRTVRILRQRIEVPSIDDVRMVDAQQGVAYLKLVCFQKNTSRDLDTALWQLHRQGMRSLIIDLRGNPGGLLVAAVEVADKFLTQGVIVSTHGRNAQEDFTYTAHEAGTWHVPLTLIIDQDSASAAEIFAGAVRDHRRGPIVGVRSYGKGSVQGIFPLNATGAGVRLTTAKFYSPTGRAYSRVGVEPDVTVRQVAKPVVGGNIAPTESGSTDAVFGAALQQASAQVGLSR
jgi:carboxyl-terminal processing protease